MFHGEIAYQPRYLPSLIIIAKTTSIYLWGCSFSRRRAVRGRPALAAKAAHPDWRQEAIPAHMFAGYVQDLQRGADAGFWKEMAAVDSAAGEAGGLSAGTNGHHAGTNGHHAGTNGHHADTNGCSKPNGQ